MRKHLPLIATTLVIVITQVICTAWAVSALNRIGGELVNTTEGVDKIEAWLTR